MKKRAGKAFLQLLCTLFFSTVLILGLQILIEGMYLLGIPRIEEVCKVFVSYPEVTEEAKIFSDQEHIELAVKLTGFLKYSPFEETKDNAAPMMTITYFLNNGETVSIAADRETLWWRGKAHAIKDKEMFIKLAEGIFFLEEVQAP